MITETVTTGSTLRFKKKLSVSKGFTLIELMIVVAIIAIILTIALPVFADYAIRARISEGISVAASAKTSVASTCIETPNLTNLTNEKAGYAYEASKWVASINVSEDCTEPRITIVTQFTGAPDPAPEITLTGNLTNSGTVTWICASDNTPNRFLPETCRSSG